MSGIPLLSRPPNPLRFGSRPAADQKSNSETPRPASGAVQARLGRFAIPIYFIGLVLATFGMLRMVYFFWFAGPGAASLSQVLGMLMTGLKFDLVAAIGVVMPQILVLGLFTDRLVRRQACRVMLECSWLFGFLFLPFVCVSEWLFFDEFHTRLNYIAFEYLVYPSEVCCNIWESYPIVPLVSGVLAIGLGLFFAFRRPFRRLLAVPLPWPRRMLLTGTYLAAAAGLWSATRMSDMNISENRVVNECANNGLYSFVYYAWTCRFDFDQLYLTIDEPEAFRAVRSAVMLPTDRPRVQSANPLDRTVSSGRPRGDYNVVLILEESLGADYVGVLGGKPGLTPRFDELCDRGLLFDNFYATGNRTARALEAVLTSLPPLPTEAILKRDRSDRVYTLANVLAKRGYERLFMTGGSGLFDGVKSFMTSNGFNHFLEEGDYESPVFTNAWGVSDEDLFRRAVAEFDRFDAAERPFFALVLTVSNHRPFTYPAGRVSAERSSRSGAVRYADWALGKFFRQAQSRPFYKNTIFVVMGDHGARVYGSQLFPMKSYRVPVLVIHPEQKIPGRRSNVLGCSMDIAPTILGWLGGSYRSTFFGRDLTQVTASEGIALMQHNHDVAMLEANNQLTVLSAGKNAWGYRLNPRTFALTPGAFPGPASLTKVIAYFQTAYRLYYGERCYPDGD